MKARARSALVTLGLLAAAAVALFLAWYWVEKPAREKAGQEAEEKLLPVGRDEVRAVRLAGRGPEVRLERAGDGWRVVAPVEAPADRAAAGALLDAALDLRRRQLVAEPDAGLGAYGLAPPRLRLTLELAGGGTRTLEAGDENPFDGSIFVRVDGGPVVSVGPGARWSLEKGLQDLREKQLFPIEERDLARLEVMGPKLAFALSRQGGEWRLAAPLSERADDAAVRQLLSTLRGLRATRFDDAPGPDSRYGLDRPRWKVALRGPGDAARVLELGSPPGAAALPRKPAQKPGGELWARVSGSRSLGAVPEGEATGLEVELWALRDKSLLRFAEDQVSVVRVERGEEAMEARRGAPAADGGASSEWTLAAPRASPIAAGKVNGLLYALSGLKAGRFADERGMRLAEHGLAPPAVVVTLLGSGGEVMARLEVGKASGEETFVRGSASPRIAAVPTASLGQIPRAPEDLAEKPAPDAGPKQGG